MLHIRLIIVRHLSVHSVESYLTSLPSSSLGADTPETSGYAALSKLLNAKGNPIGGLFTARDLEKHGLKPNTCFGKLKPFRGERYHFAASDTGIELDDANLPIHCISRFQWPPPNRSNP